MAMTAHRTLRSMIGKALPIIQSGMGGVAQPRLAAAVAEAGAIGLIGLYRHDSTEIGRLLDEGSELTRHRLGVNFVPFVLTENELEERLASVLAHPSCPIVTFFGLPSDRLLRQVGGRTLCGVQVGTFVDVKRAFANGAAFVVLQTAEAGGHHLGTMTHGEALRTLNDADVPKDRLVLSGGVGTPGEVAAALGVGFAGVLCGTVFAAATESSAHPVYKDRIVVAQPADTLVTEAFSIGWHGLPHRVIRNRSCTQKEPAGIIGKVTYFGKTYPLLRYSVAVPTEATEGDIAEMALYCGTSCKSIKDITPARSIVARLAEGL